MSLKIAEVTWLRYETGASASKYGSLTRSWSKECPVVPSTHDLQHVAILLQADHMNEVVHMRQPLQLALQLRWHRAGGFLCLSSWPAP